jgi:ATP:ADP antiporter, AAA family
VVTTKRLGSRADARAAAAATAAATVIITFQLAGKATRDALFLSTFGVAALPPMVIAAAVLSGILAIALARVMGRKGPGRLVPRLIGLSAALLLAEWALAAQARRPAVILVYLHLTALGAILVSGFWAIVNERFDPRTARGTIGRITAGGSLGGLLGGVLPERVGAALPLIAMLPILAGLHLLAAALVVAVERGAPPLPHGDSQMDGADAVLSGSRILRASSYLMGLALLVALTSAAEGVLDYVFKARAAAATTSGEELLRVFAAFYTGTALLAIFIQVTTLRKIMARLGIARSASLLPAGVSAGAIGAFLVPGLPAILLARGVEVVLRSSIFRAAYELLFTPVAPREKRATKLLLDVGAARVGDIVGGALILVALALAGGTAPRWLLIVTFALSAGALVVSRRLHLGYVGALAGSLQRRAGPLPDPVQDDAAALLQTVGAFDLSGIRRRIPLPGAPPTPPEARRQAPAASVQTPLTGAIQRGEVEEVRRLLGQHPPGPDQIETTIELLAWDAVAPSAIQSLAGVAGSQLDLLLKHLLDPEEDFAIRRRLVNVLATFRTVPVFEGLFQALGDRRFEVRYRAGRALSRMAPEIPGLEVDRDRVLGVVQREIAVGRGVWESRQLIDVTDDEASPMEAELLRDRASRSLEHLFILLSLILPRDTLRLAFHGLYTEDAYLRGTALEYLETVLPEPIWVKLWPLLEVGETRPRTGRTADQALKELVASQQSIAVALAEVREGMKSKESVSGKEQA